MPYQVLFLFSILISLVGSPAFAKDKVRAPLEELQNSELCKRAKMEPKDPAIWDFAPKYLQTNILEYRIYWLQVCEGFWNFHHHYGTAVSLSSDLSLYVDKLHRNNIDTLPFIEKTLPRIIQFLPGLEYKVSMKPFPRVTAWPNKEDFLFLNRFPYLDYAAFIKVKAALEKPPYHLNGNFHTDGINNGCLILSQFDTETALALYKEPENFYAERNISNIGNIISDRFWMLARNLSSCHNKKIQVCGISEEEARKKILSVYHFIKEDKILKPLEHESNNRKTRYFKLMEKLEKGELKIVPAPMYESTRSCL